MLNFKKNKQLKIGIDSPVLKIGNHGKALLTSYFNLSFLGPSSLFSDPSEATTQRRPRERGYRIHRHAKDPSA